MLLKQSGNISGVQSCSHWKSTSLGFIFSTFSKALSAIVAMLKKIRHKLSLKSLDLAIDFKVTC